MRGILAAGTTIANWKGVEVWYRGKEGTYRDVTSKWDWSKTPHYHYEVEQVGGGSYWVPVSSNKNSWFTEGIEVVDTTPRGDDPIPLKKNQDIYRPKGTYIWIPEASIVKKEVELFNYTNTVYCSHPTSYPPEKALAAPLTAVSLLDDVLATPQSAFQDSDGLISFVNLSSSFITNNPEFTTGRAVCDKVSNFFATLRIKVFAYLTKNPSQVLPGDTKPTTQWDRAVTHYMQFLLTQAGGLTNYRVTTETYSITQVITEFSTDFLKLVFDAVTVPEGIIEDVSNFIQGVGKSLRASWDDKSRSYQTALLGQCHEAVPVDETGNAFVYFPKIKYYYIAVDSSQQAFTSNCASVEKITFNFQYEYYVTGLKASVLDTSSTDYKKFVAFLDKAQGISYKDAENNLDSILDNTSSQPSSPELNVFGVDLREYPAAIPPSSVGASNGELKNIEAVLNMHIL